MVVTVFGASGKVGRLVVEKLLSGGHEVIAFTHSSSLTEAANLKIVQGDIHNEQDVKKAIGGSDLVISALGSWGTKEKNIVSSGMSNIIEAMNESKIKRLISLTGSDAETSDDQVTFTSRLMHKLISLSPARKILSDGEKHIKLLESSPLDWTVLRSPVMNNRGKPNHYRVSMSKPRIHDTINRQSVAQAMIDLIDNKQYYRKAPYITRSKT